MCAEVRILRGTAGSITSSNVIATAKTPWLSDSVRCKLQSAVMFYKKMGQCQKSI